MLMPKTDSGVLLPWLTENLATIHDTPSGLTTLVLGEWKKMICILFMARGYRNILTTRQVLSSAAIEQLIAQRVADAIVAYEANQNSRNESVGIDAAYETTWEELKEMMTDEYCLRNELHKLETKLWNLSVERTNIIGYTKRFQELALLCIGMVIAEYKKVKRYIKGLTEESQGKATSSKLTKIQEAIRMAHDLMDRVVRAKVAMMLTKRMWEDENGYVGTLRLCDKCRFHHHGPFPVQCGNCKNFGHQARDCWTPTSLTCYECRKEGHIRKYCPDLKNQNGIKEAYQDPNIFMELARLCPGMVISEYKKVERYIWGLTEESQGNRTSSKLTKIQEAIRMAYDLMDQVVRAKVARMLTTKECGKMSKEEILISNTARDEKWLEYTLMDQVTRTQICWNPTTPRQVQTSSPWSLPRSMWKLQEVGHQARDCWTPTLLTCYECREGHIRKYCQDLKNQNGIKEAYQDPNIFMGLTLPSSFWFLTWPAGAFHLSSFTTLATESNDVRRTTIRRPRQELVANVEVANNLLYELNRYLEQLRSHAPELLRVEALPDHPLIKYIFNALERASFVDMTNSNNLVAVMTDLLQFIADKEEMINHYRTITYVVFGMM
nr:hypothetical protein [Tanacetum cinerariifolium]